MASCTQPADLNVGGVALAVTEEQGPWLVSPSGLWQAKGYVRGAWTVPFAGDSPSGRMQPVRIVQRTAVGAGRRLGSGEEQRHLASVRRSDRESDGADRRLWIGCDAADDRGLRRGGRLHRQCVHEDGLRRQQPSVGVAVGAARRTGDGRKPVGDRHRGRQQVRDHGDRLPRGRRSEQAVSRARRAAPQRAGPGRRDRHAFDLVHGGQRRRRARTEPMGWATTAAHTTLEDRRAYARRDLVRQRRQQAAVRAGPTTRASARPPPRPHEGRQGDALPPKDRPASCHGLEDGPPAREGGPG